MTNYHNYFGNTSGLTGPNDGFHIWDRWLDTDRYRSRQALGAAASHEMQRFFDAWRTVFPQPFLNKNNRNSDCVPLLARTLTNVLFVRVRRDPIYVAQSLLLAREHIQGDRSVGWGLHSRDSVATRDPFAAIDAVCDQVMDIESKLDVNEDHVGHERFVSVEYERLCSNPGSAIERVVRRISRLCPFPEQIRTKIPPLACMNSRRISSHEMQRIEARFRAGDGRTTASLAGPAHPRLSRNATES